MLYGDGMQVRDLLFVEDLVDAFLLAQGNIHSLSGQAFNIGGGLGNTLKPDGTAGPDRRMHGAKPQVRMEDWRCGDQRYYVSDTRKFKAATGWSPKVSAREGVKRLYHWLQESRAGIVPRLWLRQREGSMRFCLINPPWTFEASIYFGCREPHLPLEYGYSKALLEQAGHEVDIVDGATGRADADAMLQSE